MLATQRVKACLFGLGLLTVVFSAIYPFSFDDAFGQTSGDRLLATYILNFSSTTKHTEPAGDSHYYHCSICGEVAGYQLYNVWYDYWRVTEYVEEWEKKGYVTVWRISTHLHSQYGGQQVGVHPCACELA